MCTNLLKNKKKWSCTKLIGGGGGCGSKNRSLGRTPLFSYLFKLYIHVNRLRSGWLGGLMPVKALEDTMTSLSLGGAEVGEEVEESEEKTEFWDIPLAFNSPRHLQVI